MSSNRQESPWIGWVFAIAAMGAVISFVFLGQYKPQLSAATGSVPGAMAASATTQAFSSENPGSASAARAATAPGSQPDSQPASQPKPRQPTSAEVMGVEPIQAVLGDATPTGKGIVVGVVEGNPGQYLPTTTHPFLEGLTLQARSGPSKTFGHTTTTATTFFGRGGVAPGIEQVHFFSAPHWMNVGVLQGSSPKVPDPGPIRFFSHSWIGSSKGNERIEQAYAEILRRVDYLADARQVLCVAGVNNGRESAVPDLLGSAYNVIAVGTYAGNSSGGYTMLEGAGRCKPDLIAQVGRTTSVSTPAVAGVVARLLETADRMPPKAQAGRAVVIRAVLLAGAVKPDDWQPQPGKPLDEHQGAGYARFDHSYHILTHGPIARKPATPLWGWDRQSIAPNTQMSYVFEVAQPTQDVSIILAWNRRIDGRVSMNLFTARKEWLSQPRLADLNLSLVRQDQPGSAGQEVAVSRSQVDNLEHIYLRQVPAGRYRLIVSRVDRLPEAWEFALAWRWGQAPATIAPEAVSP